MSPSREQTAAEPAATSMNAVIVQPTATGLPKSRFNTRSAPKIIVDSTAPTISASTSAIISSACARGVIMGGAWG